MKIQPMHINTITYINPTAKNQTADELNEPKTGAKATALKNTPEEKLETAGQTQQSNTPAIPKGISLLA